MRDRGIIFLVKLLLAAGLEVEENGRVLEVSNDNAAVEVDKDFALVFFLHWLGERLKDITPLDWEFLRQTRRTRKGGLDQLNCCVPGLIFTRSPCVSQLRKLVRDGKCFSITYWSPTGLDRLVERYVVANGWAWVATGTVVTLSNAEHADTSMPPNHEMLGLTNFHSYFGLPLPGPLGLRGGMKAIYMDAFANLLTRFFKDPKQGTFDDVKTHCNWMCSSAAFGPGHFGISPLSNAFKTAHEGILDIVYFAGRLRVSGLTPTDFAWLLTAACCANGHICL